MSNQNVSMKETYVRRRCGVSSSSRQVFSGPWRWTYLGGVSVSSLSHRPSSRGPGSTPRG